MRKCNLQKTISFLLSLVMVLGMCIVQAPETVKAADGPQVTASADKQELRRGEQVTVTAVLSGNRGVWTGLCIEFRYYTP